MHNTTHSMEQVVMSETTLIHTHAHIDKHAHTLWHIKLGFVPEYKKIFNC